MELIEEPIGIVTATAYDGSHLEGKPCSIVEISITDAKLCKYCKTLHVTKQQIADCIEIRKRIINSKLKAAGFKGKI